MIRTATAVPGVELIQPAGDEQPFGSVLWNEADRFVDALNGSRVGVAPGSDAAAAISGANRPVLEKILGPLNEF